MTGLLERLYSCSLIMIFAKDFLGQVRRLLITRTETLFACHRGKENLSTLLRSLLAAHFHSKLHQTCSIILLLMFLYKRTSPSNATMWTCFEVYRACLEKYPFHTLDVLSHEHIILNFITFICIDWRDVGKMIDRLSIFCRIFPHLRP